MIFTDSSQKCLIKALFTLCQIAFVPAQKPYQLGLQFSHESAYFCNGAQLHYANLLSEGSHNYWMGVHHTGSTIMDKSLGTLLRFWGVFQYSHRSNPSPHPTNNVGLVYPEFFPSFNFVQGEGRENCKKISKRMQCLGTLAFLGCFPIFTQVQPLPLPHKQCWMHVSRIFSEFQLCIG